VTQSGRVFCQFHPVGLNNVFKEYADFYFFVN